MILDAVFADLGFLVGCACMVAGCWLVSPSLALVVGGAMIMAGSVLLRGPRAR